MCLYVDMFLCQYSALSLLFGPVYDEKTKPKWKLCRKSREHERPHTHTQKYQIPFRLSPFSIDSVIRLNSRAQNSLCRSCKTIQSQNSTCYKALGTGQRQKLKLETALSRFLSFSRSLVLLFERFLVCFWSNTSLVDCFAVDRIGAHFYC